MKKLNFLIGIVAFGVLALLAAGCSKPVTLRLKWQAGKRYAMQMSLTQAGRLEIPGTNASIQTEMRMTEDFNVDVLQALPDGGAKLRLQFTGEKLSTKLNGQPTLHFDSQDAPQTDTNNPAAVILRKALGVSIMYEVDAHDKVKQITGLEDFYARMGDADSRLQMMVKNIMNEDLLEQLVMRAQGLPEMAVSRGDQWPVNLEVGAGPAGKMKLNLRYTLKNWERHQGYQCALLEFTGTMVSENASQEKSAQVNLHDGTIIGRSWFAPEIWMVVDTAGEQTMTLDIVSQDKKLTSHLAQQVSTKMVGLSDIPK